jgi:hypothetical protein
MAECQYTHQQRTGVAAAPAAYCCAVKSRASPVDGDGSYYCSILSFVEEQSSRETSTGVVTVQCTGSTTGRSDADHERDGRAVGPSVAAA